MFLLIISWYLNRCESSNTTFGLIDFHRYLIYNNYLIKKIIIKLKTIHIKEGSGRESGRVGSDFLSAIMCRVGSAGLTTRLTRLQPRAPDFLGAPEKPVLVKASTSLALICMFSVKS